MGKVTGVFTGYKGKVGNIVYAMWKGVQVVKTRVIPANPQTPGQTTNRVMLTAFVAMFKGIVESLAHVAWDPFDEPGHSGWSNLIGVNQKKQAGGVIDYAQCIISRGSLCGEKIVTAVYDEADGSTTVTWVNSGQVDTSPDDKAIVFIFDSIGVKWHIKTATRGDETANQTILTGLNAADIFCYLLFCEPLYTAEEINSVSDSDVKVCSEPA